VAPAEVHGCAKKEGVLRIMSFKNVKMISVSVDRHANAALDPGIPEQKRKAKCNEIHKSRLQHRQVQV
jgi:hypothetical protein